MTSKRQSDVMHESRLTPPHERRHFLAVVGFMEIPVGYGRSHFPSNVLTSTSSIGAEPNSLRPSICMLRRKIDAYLSLDAFQLEEEHARLRIHNGCLERIEKSVTQEDNCDASLVMPNNTLATEFSNRRVQPLNILIILYWGKVRRAI